MLTASKFTAPGQQLRNTNSNMFQVRQNENRAPLGTNRLQNGKLGEDPDTDAQTGVTDVGISRRWTSSMGFRRFHRANRWCTRTTSSATTNKRRTCIELRTGNGHLAAADAAQSRVSHKRQLVLSMAGEHCGGSASSCSSCRES